MKLKSLIDDKKRARAMDALRKNDPGMLLNGKKPAMEKPAGPIKNQEQSKLDREFIEACEKGDASAAQKLLNIGADVNARDLAGFTALMRAAVNNCTMMVEMLVHNGVDLNAKDDVGATALMMAGAEIAEILKKHGAKE